MNALTQLGMVSDFPSENQTTAIRSAGAEDDRKDYFVERDGIRFAGTHLLVDLWGASKLDDPDHIDAALPYASDTHSVKSGSSRCHRPAVRRNSSQTGCASIRKGKIRAATNQSIGNGHQINPQTAPEARKTIAHGFNRGFLA